MGPQVIPFEADTQLDWIALTEAIKAGHTLPKAEIDDTFLYRGTDTLLSRSAWIDGLGIAVKSATVFPNNPGPMINGAVSLFSDQDGTLSAIIDFHLVTKWKTAGDSLLGALCLARPDSQNILIIGAGTVAGSLIEAYSAGFPKAQFTIWNKTEDRARTLVQKYPQANMTVDLPAAVEAADIVCCATMSTSPVLRGAWLNPGTHVDLIGAYRPDMREADDDALRRARIFVDSRATTLGHIGELKIPLADGAITETDVLADYYEPELWRRGSPDEITLFKNGGGAHMDLMVSRYILDTWQPG